MFPRSSGLLPGPWQCPKPAICFTGPPGGAIHAQGPSGPHALHMQAILGAGAVADMVMAMDDKARAHHAGQIIQHGGALRVA